MKNRFKAPRLDLNRILVIGSGAIESGVIESGVIESGVIKSIGHWIIYSSCF